MQGIRNEHAHIIKSDKFIRIFSFSLESYWIDQKLTFFLSKFVGLCIPIRVTNFYWNISKKKISSIFSLKMLVNIHIKKKLPSALLCQQLVFAYKIAWAYTHFIIILQFYTLFANRKIFFTCTQRAGQLIYEKCSCIICNAIK